MKSRFPDDWGTPLGADEPQPQVPKKSPKKDSLNGLVFEFRDQMLMDTSNLMNSQTNALALIKAFRKALDSGLTYDNIREMIRLFHRELQGRPLSDGVPAWKAFIGRMDQLAKKVGTTEPSITYDVPKIDPRLREQNG